MGSHRLWYEAVPFVIVFVIYGLPVVWVLLSRRSRGGAKFGWFIVTVLFSWLALAVFLITTQPAKAQS